MPYFLAPPITKSLPGLWAEGRPYSTQVIYDICRADESAGDHSPSLNPNPPVHYESHALKPHSICHFDAPSHITHGAGDIDFLYKNSPQIFYGYAVVLNLGSPRFADHLRVSRVKHWQVSLAELKSALELRGFTRPPPKLILTFERIGHDFYASADQAFTLSLDAAKWLAAEPGFNLLVTPWKSVDFEPGSRERPIHRTLFPKIGVLECVNLEGVPEGEYFLSAPPLPLEGATESPVSPVLFTRQELQF